MRKKSSARDTGDTTAQPPANSKVGSNAEKYKDAGRLGGNWQTEKTTTAATTTAATTASKSKTTLLDSARKTISERNTAASSSTGSNANLLAEALFQAKYGATLKKAVAEIAQKNASTAKSTKSTATSKSTKSTPTAETTKRTSTAKTGTQAKQSTQKTTDAVAAHGSMADYALVRQAAAKVDFTDWEKKTTTQQRAVLKRSGLTEEEQWTLLNKDSSYVETLSVISDLRDNRADYGLSLAEVEQVNGELLSLAAARANASGNGQPYLSTIPRAQMVKYLDEQRDILLRSIGYLESDTVGGDTGLWYDGEEEGPMPGPGENKEFRLTERSEAFAKQLMRARSSAISLGWRLALEKTLRTVFGSLKVVGDAIASGSDLATVLVGQENWLDYVRPGEEETATWDDTMITDQRLYSKAIGSFGTFGNYDDNGCGPIAIHNVNRLLGEDSTFADVAYELDSDSRNTAAFGGVLGMNPLVVREYFGSKGYDVTLYDGTEGVKENHDAYLAMYIYKNPDGSLGGHYVAMKRDPEEKEYITYNEVYSTGPVPMKKLDHLGRIDKNGNVDDENPRLLTVVWGIDKER